LICNRNFRNGGLGSEESSFKVMDGCRCRSVDSLRGYIRDAELFKDHAIGAGAASLAGKVRLTSGHRPDPFDHLVSAADAPALLPFVAPM
jgi:hypothetical protein